MQTTVTDQQLALELAKNTTKKLSFLMLLI